MFERFDDTARMALVESQEAARELGHDYIGNEHLLLALLRHDDTGTARSFALAGLSEVQAREAVLDIVGRGPGESGQIPFTTGFKKVLELATVRRVAKGGRVRDLDLALEAVRVRDDVIARVFTETNVDVSGLDRRLGAEAE